MIELEAKAVLLAAAAFFVVGTALPLLHYDHWTVRFFDFPRVQMTVGSGATLAGIVAVGPASVPDYGAIALLGACLIHQIDHILPYTPLAPCQVRDAEPQNGGPHLSLLVCNVEVDNRDAGPLLDLIGTQQPDLVLALETDDWWADRLQPLRNAYPHAIEQPQDNAYGMVLYSKHPFVDAEVRHLVDAEVPSIHAQVAIPNGAIIYVHGLHPRPPHPTHDPDTTERDAELLHLARQIQDRDAPTIVTGDLNDVSWSYTTRLFQNISGLLDPRKGRGTYNTFHARYPLLRYPLDHTFHSPHFRLAALRVLPYVGSDHFPVYIDLQYDPEAAVDQDAPQADAIDEAQAKHELEKLHKKKKQQG